jgi:hypothetical protein
LSLRIGRARCATDRTVVIGDGKVVQTGRRLVEMERS